MVSSELEAMAAASDADLARLIARIAHGDALAFRAFYDATVQRCYALALSLLSAPVAAEDCVSETYAQVWRAAAAFDVSRAGPIAWLTMICRSRAIDLLRREQARGVTLQPTDATAEADMRCASVDVDDEWLGTARVRAALARLGSAEQRLVALAYAHDLTHAEIAESTGIPLGTVKSRLRRALQALRKELNPDEAPSRS